MKTIPATLDCKMPTKSAAWAKIATETLIGDDDGDDDDDGDGDGDDDSDGDDDDKPKTN